MTANQPRRIGALLLSALLGGCGDDDGPPRFVPPPPPDPLTAISSLSPYPPGCSGSQAGTLYLNAEVEPFAAANPANPDNLIAVWQQDRWSNGGAQGILAGVSYDGGATWATRVVPFSRCAGGTVANGGDYARATDPWITFAPDGKVFFMSLSITDPSFVSAMLVSRSLDGGTTWEDPVALIRDQDSELFNDKNTITADPLNSNYVYAVWDRLEDRNPSTPDFDAGPALFSRTTDGGETWETARAIYDPIGGQTVGNVIAVLPDGTLVDLFVEIEFTSGDALLRVIRSTDRGENWSAPVTVAELLTVGVSDPETDALLRTGAGAVPSIAVRGADGRLAVAWEDSRFSAGQRDAIALAYSDDGGLSWSEPVAINGDLAVPAFTPTLAYLADGTLGVGYYDLRENTPSDDTLLADNWLAFVGDAGIVEQKLSGPFNMNLAPNAYGLFLGDYMGMLPSGEGLRPFFVQTGTDTGNRTSLFTLQVEAPGTASAKSLRLPLADPRRPLSDEARARVRKAIERALPHHRHDPPFDLQMPNYAVLP